MSDQEAVVTAAERETGVADGAADEYPDSARAEGRCTCGAVSHDVGCPADGAAQQGTG